MEEVPAVMAVLLQSALRSKLWLQWDGEPFRLELVLKASPGESDRQ
jgi:hypothetical protein